MSLGVVKSQRHHLDQHSQHKRHQKTCCRRKLLGMWTVTTEPGKSETRKRHCCEAPAAAMGKWPPRRPLSILNLSRAQHCFPIAKSLSPWCCIQTCSWGHYYFLLLPMARFTGSTPPVFFSTLNSSMFKHLRAHPLSDNRMQICSNTSLLSLQYGQHPEVR